MSINFDSKTSVIYISGAYSGIGKSIFCLGLIGALLKEGFKSSDIGYIKPVTQCIDVQLVTKFCESQQIEHIGIGPVVFHKHFTRNFLDGLTDNSNSLKFKIKNVVDRLKRGKQFIIVDGVGYPAVGSIVGTSNADVAALLEAQVLLIGKSGIGDAIDNMNLNRAYFERYGVSIIGGLFNNIPIEKLDDCRKYVSKYYHQSQADFHIYGFIPEIPELTEDNVDISTHREDFGKSILTESDKWRCKSIISTVNQYIDIGLILDDLMKFSDFSKDRQSRPNC